MFVGSSLKTWRVRVLACRVSVCFALRWGLFVLKEADAFLKFLSVRWRLVVFLFVAFAGLYGLSRINFLVFHSLAEMFSVVIASSIFVIAWNSRRLESNGFLMILGVSGLFVGLVTFLHVLAYQGMGVFPNSSVDLATQLWLVMRFLYVGAFVAAIFFVNRQVKASNAFLAFGVGTFLLLCSIFFGLFPAAFIEGSGLTLFKVVSEYAISALFGVALFLLHRNKAQFDSRVFWLFAGSIVFAVFTELSFTLYVDVFGFMTVLGHLFEVLSFVLLYLGLVESGFSHPLSVMFKNLERSRNLLEKERDDLNDARNFAESVIAAVREPLVVLDERLCVVSVNDSFYKLFGTTPSNTLGRRLGNAGKLRWNAESLEKRLKDVLKTGQGFDDFETVCIFSEESGGASFTGRHVLSASARKLVQKTGLPMVLLALDDVTDRKQFEAHVEHLASIPHASPTLICELDLDGLLTYVNPSALKEFPNLRQDGLTHQWLAGFKTTAKKAMARGRAVREVAVDGKTFLQTFVSVQNPPRIRVHGVEITSLKQAQDAVVKERKISSGMMENSGVHLAYLDKNFNYVTLNKAYAKSFGLSVSEVAGRNFFDLFTGQKKISKTIFERLTTSKEPIEVHDAKLEFANQSNTSHRFWDWKLAPVNDSYDRVIGFVHALKETTRRKKLETALENSLLQARLRSNELNGLFASLSEPLFWYDREGRVQRCNAATVKSLEFDPVGMRFNEIVRRLNATCMSCGKKKCVSPPLESALRGETMESGLQFFSSKGVEKTFVGAVSPIRAGSQVIGAAETWHDISSLKNAEAKAANALSEKETLLKEVHHRVKNNLQMISSLLSLQSRGVKDQTALKMFDESRGRVKCIADVHELLYRSGDLKSVDFQAYLNNIVKDAASLQSKRRNISVKVDVQDVFLSIDHALPCGLIVNELVSNAFKHAFEGRKRGEIVAFSRLSGKKLVLSIKDDGVGLPAFSDVETSSLGLQLVESLTRQLGGKMRIIRKVGTEFRFSIPIKADSHK